MNMNKALVAIVGGFLLLSLAFWWCFWYLL